MFNCQELPKCTRRAFTHVMLHITLLLSAGEVINEKDRCKVCLGKKVTKESKQIEVHIDKGMKHEQKVVLRGEGDQSVRYGFYFFFLVRCLNNNGY